MNQHEADPSNPNMPKKCPQCGRSLPADALDGLCPACLLAQGVTAETGPETAPFQPPTVEEVAKLFPQLEILAFIGKGGMGAVYKARQPELDRFVALKILPPQAASGPGFAERFNREARALARLSHPNIVAVHEFGQVNGLPFFVMEFVDGLNLRQLERTRKLSAREALQIVPQICEALQFAHDEGIVHRDIKPENILLDKKGRVKIADFGIAKLMGRETEADLTDTKGVIGTPNYMAPEQVEKPETVDHRADIFALGVVFYEMLTGELPLGKFAPPSSGRVEVDVRLDEVVLRALEKEPERRYQHASQVKTAVETIASAGAAASAPPPDAEALAGEILARDYVLDIGSCFSRAWTLVSSDFWATIGVAALISLLCSAASSTLIGIIVNGPLMGGLWLYFLKKARGEKPGVETAFSGFSIAFAPLMLAWLVAKLLTFLGFLCLILPGIYLMVAWKFTLPLVADKRLAFWPAMELSRRVVTRHWWKFLAFGLLAFLLNAAGFLVLCGLGMFFTAPFTLAAAAYAYEDIFGAAARTAGAGPHGTAVLPGATTRSSPSAGGAWKFVLIGLAALFFLMVVMLAAFFLFRAKRHRNRVEWQEPVAIAQSTETGMKLVFGPIIERTIQARATGTNQFLDIDFGTLLTPSPEIASALAAQPGEDENRLWQALDIPVDSERFRYTAWLRESGADLMFAGDGKIIGFDGAFALAHSDSPANWNDWDGLSPERTRDAVDVVAWFRRATEARRSGRPAPPGPATGGIVNSAFQLDSQIGSGPLVNLLTREQSALWFFKTRGGVKGVLQIMESTDDPSAMRVRYKLVRSDLSSNDTLAARLEAASSIGGNTERDAVLARLARDAADAGEIEVVNSALREIRGVTERDQAAFDAARRLVRIGLRKQAVDIA